MIRKSVLALKSANPVPLNPFKDGYDATAAGKRILEKITTTVWDIMSKNIPNDRRAIYAAQWGFAHNLNEKIRKRHIEETDQPTSLMQLSETISRSDGENSSVTRLMDDSVEDIGKREVIHSLFGELVCDMAYKKIYRTSVERLVRVPIWQKQRILRADRAESMAKDKMKEISTCSDGNLKMRMPGIITLYQDRENPELTGIVDGQHRVAALMIMSNAGAWDKAANNIAVDVIPTSNEQEICDLFTEINKAEPVRLVDMPGEGAGVHIRAILAEAVQTLGTNYPSMIKLSTRCKPPHINLDVLRDDIFQSDLMGRHELHTTAQLLAWLDDTNNRLASHDETHWNKMFAGRSQIAVNAALKKAQKYRFYLGLDKSWLYA